MDILTFIAEVLKATAWPTAFVCALIIFRGEVRTLLSRLKKGSWGGAEVEFEEGVKELVEEQPVTQRSEATPALVAGDSRGLVLDAWSKLESAATDLSIKLGLARPAAQRTHASLLHVMRQGIGPEAADVFHQLRVLKNRAAHDSDFRPDPQTVLQFAQLAGALEHSIRQKLAER